MKIAWFSDIIENSALALFTKCIVDVLIEEHQVQIFSTEKTRFYDYNVENYLTYEYSNFDFTIFLIKDDISSYFSYEASLIYPGLRILFDRNINNLSFSKIEHITNGIVFDELLKEKGYSNTISIASYHMRGWSLEPYKKLFPFEYKTSASGLNLLVGKNLLFPLNLVSTEKFKSDFNIYILGKLPDTYGQIIEKLNIKISNQITESSICIVFNDLTEALTIKAAENAIPLIFVSSTNYFNQINIVDNLKGPQILENLLKKLQTNKDILVALKKNLVDYAVTNNAVNITNYLINICYQSAEILNISNYKMLNDYASVGSQELMENFLNRFELIE